MDTTRWKSILVPREVYEEIKELSKNEGRTIGGQLRLVFDWYRDSKKGSADDNQGDRAVSQKIGGKPVPKVRAKA
jgi:hypothetical protein|tara:strand:+ start:1105 stop:1329 length:225 start_codon:yes stop_codon:yes gene_type:complete